MAKRIPNLKRNGDPGYLAPVPTDLLPFFSNTANETQAASMTEIGAMATPDATSSTKGKVQLAGELGGTAAAPTLKNIARVFNVKDYGAVGDGTTNDGVAINLAITALNAAAGGVLYFPHGTYYITGRLTAP